MIPRLLVAFIALFSFASSLHAADVPAPGFQDIARSEASELCVLLSGDHPKVSFRAFDSVYVLSDSLLGSKVGPSQSETSVALSLLECIRDSKFISVKAAATGRKTSTGLDVLEITDIGIHF